MISLYYEDMNWIDDRLAEDQLRGANNASIREAAPKIYAEFLDCIKADVNQAFKKKVRLSMGGHEANPVVKLELPDGTVRTLNCSFRSDKPSIVCSGSIDREFAFTVEADGLVGLTDEQGNRITSAEAARAILDPFMFPHLQPLK
jgi:hypothetical protein